MEEENKQDSRIYKSTIIFPIILIILGVSLVFLTEKSNTESMGAGIIGFGSGWLLSLLGFIFLVKNINTILKNKKVLKIIGLLLLLFTLFFIYNIGLPLQKIKITYIKIILEIMAIVLLFPSVINNKYSGIMKILKSPTIIGIIVSYIILDRLFIYCNPYSYYFSNTLWNCEFFSDWLINKYGSHVNWWSILIPSIFISVLIFTIIDFIKNKKTPTS